MAFYRRTKQRKEFGWGLLRSISLFDPGTFGILPQDRWYVAKIHALENVGVVKSTLTDGVIIVDVTEKGWAVLEGDQIMRRWAS